MGGGGGNPCELEKSSISQKGQWLPETHRPAPRDGSVRLSEALGEGRWERQGPALRSCAELAPSVDRPGWSGSDKLRPRPPPPRSRAVTSARPGPCGPHLRQRGLQLSKHSLTCKQRLRPPPGPTPPSLPSAATSPRIASRIASRAPKSSVRGGVSLFQTPAEADISASSLESRTPLAASPVAGPLLKGFGLSAETRPVAFLEHEDLEVETAPWSSGCRTGAEVAGVRPRWPPCASPSRPWGARHPVSEPSHSESFFSQP